MTYGQATVEVGPPRIAGHPPQQHSVHQTQSAHPPQNVVGQGGLQPQRSFSSSEEERSTPECASDEPDESEKGESTFDICGLSISGFLSASARRCSSASSSRCSPSSRILSRVDDRDLNLRIPLGSFSRRFHAFYITIIRFDALPIVEPPCKYGSVILMQTC